MFPEQHADPVARLTLEGRFQLRQASLERWMSCQGMWRCRRRLHRRRGPRAQEIKAEPREIPGMYSFGRQVGQVTQKKPIGMFPQARMRRARPQGARNIGSRRAAQEHRGRGQGEGNRRMNWNTKAKRGDTAAHTGVVVQLQMAQVELAYPAGPEGAEKEDETRRTPPDTGSARKRSAPLLRGTR